eukprot:g2071.t1
MIQKEHGFWCSTYNLACVLWALRLLCEIPITFPKDRLLYSKPQVKNPLNCHFGYAVLQGRRSTMEDRIYIEETIENLGRACKLKEPVTFFAVFDGHAGSLAADISVETLPDILKSHLSEGEDPTRALINAFKNTDRIVLNETIQDGDQIIDASGSTCVACLLDSDGRIYTANLGDSRAIMFATHDQQEQTEGKEEDSLGERVEMNSLEHAAVQVEEKISKTNFLIELSKDQKAHHPREIARIAERGGFVVNKRLYGSLAVARALGDAIYKQKGVLSCSPDITQMMLSEAPKFIVLASDGLWDVCSSDQVATYCKQGMKQGKSPHEIAESLAEHAIQNLKSSDNVSIVIAYVHKS